MSNPAVKLPPGFTLVDNPEVSPVDNSAFDPATAVPNPTAPAATALTLPAGFKPIPPPHINEDNYFKQVKDRVGGMASALYDAWKSGDIETMSGLPATIGAVNKQYYETLWKSKSPAEFAFNLLPIFGPSINEAAAKAGQGKPQTSAAILTSDILLPILADRIPGAVAELIPSSVKKGASAAAKETATSLYSSAAKPPISGKPGMIAKTEKALQTALSEEIPVSRGGAMKLVSALNDLNSTSETIFKNAPEPELVIEPRMRVPELTAGSTPGGFTTERMTIDIGGKKVPIENRVDRLPAGTTEVGPPPPAPGTKQTVLSHAEEVNSETALRIKPNYTEMSANPAYTGAQLEQARNAQLMADIEKRAQDSGLLESVQNAARAADQPVPYSIFEVFNFKVKNAIDPQKVAARLDQLKKRFQTTNPEADLAAIDAAREEFLRQYPNPISYKEAQGIKQRTYAALKDKAYGEQKGAKAESMKTLAHGIMEELEAALPEVQFVNKREGSLLGLRPIILRAIGRVRNWDVIGLTTTAAAAVGGAIGAPHIGMGATESATAAAVIAMALRDPWVKSKLAIAINRAAKLDPVKFGAPSIAAAEARIAAYQSAIERAAAGAIPASVSDQQNNPDVAKPARSSNVGWVYEDPEQP